jgi:hypothetical protein
MPEELTEVELYALALVGDGALDYAQEDFNEEEELSEKDHPVARKLGIEMAKAIAANRASFYAWYQKTTA